MTVPTTPEPPFGERLARWGTGTGLALAGLSHLTFARQGFSAQVPSWIPVDTDDVVLVSGAVEIALGAALLGLPKERRRLGGLTALFFVAVFPGNIAQYVDSADGLGLDTDTKRFARLFFQPLMCAVALHAGGLLRRRRPRE